MLQNRWRLGLCPRPRWGAYSAPPDPLAVMGWDRDLMTPSLGSANTLGDFGRPPTKTLENAGTRCTRLDESMCFASS